MRLLNDKPWPNAGGNCEPRNRQRSYLAALGDRLGQGDTTSECQPLHPRTPVSRDALRPCPQPDTLPRPFRRARGVQRRALHPGPYRTRLGLPARETIGGRGGRCRLRAWPRGRALNAPGARRKGLQKPGGERRPRGGGDLQPAPARETTRPSARVRAPSRRAPHRRTQSARGPAGRAGGGLGCRREEATASWRDSP